MAKPKFLKLKEEGEFQSYMHDLYESIDYEKHEEFINNN